MAERQDPGIERLRPVANAATAAVEHLQRVRRTQTASVHVGMRISRPPEERQRAYVERIQAFTETILQELQERPELFYNFTPGAFEEFVADRLEAMGMKVEPVGGVDTSDGGIDLVATLRTPVPGGFRFCVQVKHHRRPKYKVTSPEVWRLLGRQGDRSLRAGLLVTNTDFTNPAWAVAAEEYNRFWIVLRNGDDITRWVRGDFSQEARELPERYHLGAVDLEIPGTSIDVRLVDDER